MSDTPTPRFGRALRLFMPLVVVALFVVVPYLFAFVATLHISDYVSYREVFHSDEMLAPIVRK